MHTLLLAALLVSIPPVQPPQPNRQPQLASIPGLTALVFGNGASIWFAASHDDGRTFSAATQVAQVPVLALGRHRGPRVVISGKTIVVSAVFGVTVATGEHAHGLPDNGDLVAWQSLDGGHSWSKPIVINDVPGAAREGLHSMTAGANGELAAVWLDLRSKGTRLYGSYSKDHGATWSKNVMLYESPDGTICQCCDPSITSSGPDRFSVMFRNALDGKRDMYLGDWNLSGPISTPRKLGAGTWELNACPMDGGGLAHTAKGIVTAWRRDGTVYLSQPDQPEIPLGEGKDIALAATAQGPYVAWTSPAGIFLSHPNEKSPEKISPAGSFPTLIALPSGAILIAWEQDAQIHLKTETVSLHTSTAE